MSRFGYTNRKLDKKFKSSVVALVKLMDIVFEEPQNSRKWEIKQMCHARCYMYKVDLTVVIKVFCYIW